MSVWLIVGLCFAPSVLLTFTVALAAVRRRFDDRDRCRRIAVLAERERDGWERLRSGAAWVEAWLLQLNEIRELPTVEPWRRWLPR